MSKFYIVLIAVAALASTQAYAQDMPGKAESQCLSSNLAMRIYKTQLDMHAAQLGMLIEMPKISSLLQKDTASTAQ
jgi:hypothetical protein